MLLETLGGAIAGQLKGLALKPATNFLQAVLANEKAFDYARENVRSEFEPLIQPASYDHVVGDMRLSRNDFIRYYQTTLNQREAVTLGEYVRMQLSAKLGRWIHNVPQAEILDRMVERFYQAYENYFLTTDPGLATLHLIGVSDEVLRTLNDLRGDLSKLTHGSGVTQRREPFFDELQLFLIQMNVPHEVIERGPGHMDIEVTEHGTILPSKLYISAFEGTPSTEELDEALSRSRFRGHAHRTVVITAQMPTVDVHKYGEKRGVTLLTLTDFRQSILDQGQQQHIVLGTTSSLELAKSYNIDEVYIPPDGVRVRPNQAPDFLPGESRTPMDAILKEFLAGEDQILIVLGDYGSGKSAWCAHVTRELTRDDRSFIPVYVALRYLKDANELPKVVPHAARLAKSYRGVQSRVVVIADGFDEMPNAMEPKEKRLNMLRLIDAIRADTKLILTARTSYFRGLDDLWHLFETGDAPDLWNRMARYIPSGKTRLRVRAVMLHGFNNQQIDRYVYEIARIQGRDEDFARTFLTELNESDPHGVYRQMARNPLYLFLLVNTEPWKDTSVESIADVLSLLIRYWLERDIEKGPSRWFLLTQDRLEFMAYLAWRMHHTGMLAVDYEKFNEMVRAFYRITDPSDDSVAIALDLQTTGVFGSSAGTIYFLLPAVMDYFVATQFADGAALPDDGRLPTVDQGRIWLALAETRGVKKMIVDDTSWYQERGVRFSQKDQRITIDPTGILYGVRSSDRTWPVVNDRNEELIAVLDHVLHPKTDNLPNAIRVRILNKYGMHARPVADAIRAYHKWRAERPSTAALGFRYLGKYVPAESIMGLMFLAIEGGAKFHLAFEGCTREEAEAFLAMIGGRKVNQPEIDWELQTEPE